MAKRDKVLSLSELVKHLLERHGVPFEVWDRSDYLTILHAMVASGFGEGGRLARVVFLRDEAGLVLALLSDPEDTDLPAKRLSRPLIPTLPFDVMDEAAPETVLWVAPEFRNADNLVLDVGSGQEVIQVSLALMEEGFHPQESEEVTEMQVYELLARIALESPQPQPLWNLGERLQAQDGPPELTPFAEAAMTLFFLPEPQPEELLTLVASQTLAHPRFPQHDPVLQRIAHLVEGEGDLDHRWDEALHLTLGYALSRQFPVMSSGLLGAPWCWRHLLLTARLCGELAEESPVGGLERRRAMLVGWLHDVGLLYLAQAFPREFAIFNHLLERHPHRALEDMERQLLGLSHADLGAALLHHWGLDEELVEAVRSHHLPEQDSTAHPYGELVFIADRLAHRRDGGDAASPIIPPWLLRRHGLAERDLGAFLEQGRAGLALIDTLL